MHSKLPKSKDSLENVGPEANREKKTRKPKHIDVEVILEAIFVSSWGTWEAFGGHVVRLGTILSQHKAILSQLGANLRPPEAKLTSINMSQHEPTWSPRNVLDGSKTLRVTLIKPQLSHG